jgi:hypothetical protein
MFAAGDASGVGPRYTSGVGSSRAEPSVVFGAARVESSDRSTTNAQHHHEQAHDDRADGDDIALRAAPHPSHAQHNDPPSRVSPTTPTGDLSPRDGAVVARARGR